MTTNSNLRFVKFYNFLSKVFNSHKTRKFSELERKQEGFLVALSNRLQTEALDFWFQLACLLML